MSARLILHVITTLVLFAIGWWLYMRMEENSYDAIDSVNVAVFWFASLVYIFFSWIFYWIVHRLKLKAWVIAQILAIIIAAVSTVTLLYVSREHQQELEQKALQQDQDAEASSEEEQVIEQSEMNSEDKLETLNLSEDGVAGETDESVE